MTVLISLFLLLGAFLFLLAAIGILRLPDALSRMHAASKGSSLGVCFILTACALTHASLSAALKSLIVMLAVFLTLPVATHLLARASMQGDELESLRENKERGRCRQASADCQE
ncbi:MAG: monovalent cation/H(+) antiporter subunit G [Candidatus Omnitrophica bacterium]|nr:monovalent cation/H(+) antiporter subunit G [Candidatus Omnitrophota bacterium]